MALLKHLGVYQRVRCRFPTGNVGLQISLHLHRSITRLPPIIEPPNKLILYAFLSRVYTCDYIIKYLVYVIIVGNFRRDVKVSFNGEFSTVNRNTVFERDILSFDRSTTIFILIQRFRFYLQAISALGSSVPEGNTIPPGASREMHVAPCCRAMVFARRSRFTLRREMYCEYVCSWHNIHNKMKQGFTRSV